MSRCPPSTKSEIGVLEDRGSSWQEFGCLGNLSLYNEQLLLSTPLLKALSSLSRYPLSTKSSWRTGYASWRIQTLMEGSYTYFLQVHQVSTIQVQVLGLELIHRSCHQLFHRPLLACFSILLAQKNWENCHSKFSFECGARRIGLRARRIKILAWEPGE